MQVVEYCCNDVRALEAVFDALQAGLRRPSDPRRDERSAGQQLHAAARDQDHVRKRSEPQKQVRVHGSSEMFPATSSTRTARSTRAPTRTRPSAKAATSTPNPACTRTSRFWTSHRCTRPRSRTQPLRPVHRDFSPADGRSSGDEARRLHQGSRTPPLDLGSEEDAKRYPRL
jgi:hypothetical protein